MFKQLDIVSIVTTKGIKYLSGPEGHATNPHGNWSIVGFVGSDAVLAKESTLIKVPLSDLKKVAAYNPEKFLKQLSTAGYLKSKTISIANHISKMFDINIAEARQFLLDNGLKLNVKTDREKETIIEKVKELWPKRRKTKT